MKKLLIVWFLMLHSLYALEVNECLSDVYFANGINTDEISAKKSRDMISKKFKSFNPTAYKKVKEWKVSYNHTHGMGIDLYESFLQKIYEDEPGTSMAPFIWNMDEISDYFVWSFRGVVRKIAEKAPKAEIKFYAAKAAKYLAKKAFKAYNKYGKKFTEEQLEAMFKDAFDYLIEQGVDSYLTMTEDEIAKQEQEDVATQETNYIRSIAQGHGVVIVAHSQGNLFTNRVYTDLKFGNVINGFEWMRQYIDAIGVATPANNVIGSDSPYITFDNDMIHLVPDSLPANVVNPKRYHMHNAIGEDIGETLYSVQAHSFLSSYMATDITRDAILGLIDQKIGEHKDDPSQWEKDKDFGCLCREKAISVKHKFLLANSYAALNRPGLEDILQIFMGIPKHKIKNFAGEGDGKIYTVGDKWVRAACGGTTIEEVKEGETCLALKDGKTVIGRISGSTASPEKHAGVVEVTLEWDKPELDYDLAVQWGAGEMDVKDTGCGMEHFYISSEKKIYPGRYPIYVTPHDPTDPVWNGQEHNTTYSHHIKVTITTPGKGADASWKAEAVITSRTKMQRTSHIADIKVYRVNDDNHDNNNTSGGNNSSGGGSTSSPIQIAPVIPPECPPDVQVTLPEVPRRPIYPGGSSGRHWGGGSSSSSGGGGGWTGSSSHGGGSTLPVQKDPTCSGDTDCLPTPTDDPGTNPDDPDDPYTTPDPSAGGVPQRDLNETGECQGNFSCHCIPCEYKVIPDLKQIYFGPLQDANFTIYSLEGYRQGHPLYRGQTTHGKGLYDSGEVVIPDAIEAQFADEGYYIIRATGGEDIDANDDFHKDDTPTINHGTVYAIATGREIKHLGFKVNILTTVSFTLLKEMLEGNATVEQIREKQSDIASRLLRYKLYPDKTEKQITNTDLLVWLPTVDQDVLLRNYTPLEEMVQKIYDNEPISEAARRYVYGMASDTNASDPDPDHPLPPIIRSFSGKIDENATGGTEVGRIEVLRGGDTVTFDTLTGKGAEMFDLSPDGVIRLREDAQLDYEQKWLYILKADAHSTGGSSGKVSVYISVNDVVDAPKYLSIEGGVVDENATPGTVIGKLNYDPGLSPVTEIKLYGASKDLFDVDSNGTIRLAEGAELDYEKHRYYGLVAVAQNDQGTSVPTILYLYVRDIADVPHIVGYDGGYVFENAAADTYVGRVRYEEGGAPVTRASLQGEGSENFTIDRNGTIRVAEGADLDYEHYSLYRLVAVLENDYGEVTYPVFVSVRDVADVPSYLDFEGGNVDENSPIGTQVGRVFYGQGASPITTMRLNGSDAEYFSIDLDGTVRLKKEVDYETQHDFVVTVVAVNALGESQPLTLYLFVNDVAEELAVLDDCVVNDVEENLSVGSIIGHIPILYEGSGAITEFAVSGDNAGTFQVDRNGTVTLSRTLDYESHPIYNLKVKARNDAGFGFPVNLIIRLSNVPDVPPTLGTLNATVTENAPVGTVVGSVPVVDPGDGDITGFTLSRPGSENFHIDANGTIRVAGAIDYEQNRYYYLEVKAQSNAGESERGWVNIAVQNVPDVPPVLHGKSYHVREDVPIGTVVGTVPVRSAGDAPITAYALDDNTTFTIDANGTILTAVPLDYETQTRYTLHAAATNVAGTSDPAILTIDIDDVIDDEPILEPLEISIEENTTVGTVIGTIEINSTGTSPITQMILSGYREKFRIDRNGTVTLAAQVDYETVHEYNLWVRAVNAKAKSAWVKLTVRLQNIVDTPPSWPWWGWKQMYVEENATIGTRVGQVNFDFNPGDASITAYSLDDNTTFTIDRNGTIRTAVPLDYETQRDYDLRITATNAAGTSAPATYTINIGDVIDTRPVLWHFWGHVIENSPIGTVVGTVAWDARTGDAPETYMLDDNTTFTIDANGTIRTAAPLDYETRTSYILHATATNAFGTSAPVALAINIDNVVDDEPVIEPLEASIEENATVGTVIGTVEINSTGTSAISGIALTGDGAEAFDVDSNGTVTLVGAIDYESRNTYRLQAIATNAKASSAAVDVVIHILNIPDVPPVLNGTSHHVQEDAPIGTVVGTVPVRSAGDAPITAYTLDDNTTFTIDANGTIRTAASLDYETQRSYTLHATVSNTAGTSDPVAVTIHIDDVLDARPVIYFRGHVVENSPVGTVVGTVGWDPQSGDAPDTYALDDNTTFTIDSGGTIRTAAPLDYETQTRYTVHVTATNAFGTSEPVVATINIDNVIDDEPVLEPLEISIEENTTVGTVIGTIEINSTGTSPVKQIILSGKGAEKFRVDRNGTMTLTQTVDYEDESFCGYHHIKNHRFPQWTCLQRYDLHAAADNDHGHSPSVSVIVHITNVVDTPPQPRGARFHVEENATIGTRVGRLNFYPGEAPIISYTLGDIFYTIDDNGTFRALEDNTTFTIDANGTIYTSAPLDYERLKNYLLAVTATNAVGTSEPGYAWIIIDNVIDDEPVLADTNLTVPDHAPVGTVVGTLEITTTGTSELNDINLTGEGADHFDVALDGTITLTQTVDRATQEVYHLQAVAVNDKAQSQPVAVTIQVDSMPPAIAGALRFPTGWIRDIARSADGTRAYLADGEAGLLIVDTSDPAHITMLSHLYPFFYPDDDENGYAIGVTLSADGNILYLADGEHGLLIIDVSDPTDPFELGRVGTEHYTMSTTLSADGATAYVADGDGGLKIVDVRDPADPYVISELNSTSWSYQVALSPDETTAYVADGWNGLQIIDVQEHAYPYIRNTVDTPGDATGITLSGDGSMAYVADGGGGLKIMDVNDPDYAMITGALDSTSWSYKVTLSPDGTTAYVSDGWNGLTRMDITDPTDPVIIDTIDTPGDTWNAVLSDDATTIWVADSYGGLQIVTIDGEGNSTISGTFNTYDEAKHIALSHDGTRAYVTTKAGSLKVVNVEADDDPYILGSVNVAWGMTGLAITPDDRYACITNYAGLSIVRVNNEDNISVVSVSDTPGLAEDIVLSGDGTLAYVADGEEGMQIFDISDPIQPNLVGSLDTDGYAQKLALSHDGTLLYIADGDNGVLQIDVSDPAHPVLKGRYETYEEVTHVLLSADGTKLYYTVGENIWVVWIDSDDFSASQPDGGRSIDGRITGLALSRDGRSIYVTGEQTGLRIVSTGNMEVQQTLETDGTAYGIAVSGDGRHMYLADGEAGLVIVNPGSY